MGANAKSCGYGDTNVGDDSADVLRESGECGRGLDVSRGWVQLRTDERQGAHGSCTLVLSPRMR